MKKLKPFQFVEFVFVNVKPILVLLKYYLSLELVLSITYIVIIISNKEHEGQ